MNARAPRSTRDGAGPTKSKPEFELKQKRKDRDAIAPASDEQNRAPPRNPSSSTSKPSRRPGMNRLNQEAAAAATSRSTKTSTPNRLAGPGTKQTRWDEIEADWQREITPDLPEPSTP